MAIPEAQLKTWANIGAQATSKDTYATVKTALESREYGGKSYCVFLQGSYGNDTNIFQESDVDVVIELTGNFYYNLSQLPPQQEAAFKEAHPAAAPYDFAAFRADVLSVLQARFGAAVNPGTKAITINALNNRRKADVLVAYQHRVFRRFNGVGNDDKVTGVCFFKSDGTQIVNYPRLHSERMTAKNQDTHQWFKHLVRIFKNARQKLIDDGAIENGVAPSYYLEGLVYNVTTGNFGTSYQASMMNVINYIVQADRSQFRCPNGQYLLLDDDPNVSWNTTDCNRFLNALVDMWKQW